MGNRSDYGNNIEGIPLPGDIPQVEGSAAPNRDDSETLHNPEGQPEQEPVGSAPSKAQPDQPFVASKDDETWSPGLEDEENNGYMSFSEQDQDWNEGLFPETEPLQVEGQSEDQSKEEFSDIELKPDNIQYGPE